MASSDYVTLMASLPALGPVLQARHAPINRARLERRLSQLRHDHFCELNALADLLSWARLPLLEDDRELVKRARRMIPMLSSETLRTLARDRLELRTLIAALRYRHSGNDAPPQSADWGYGRYVSRIAANWRERGFGLEHVFPFVLPANDALEKEDVRALERIVLEVAWGHAERLSVGHTFDYEAVALYLVRWNLLDRWTRYDAQAAAARFDQIVLSVLDDASERLNHLRTEKVST